MEDENSRNMSKQEKRMGKKKILSFVDKFSNFNISINKEFMFLAKQILK